MGKRKHDWAQLQKDYDNGFSYSDLKAKYGVAGGVIRLAIKRGEFKARSRTEGVRLAKITKPLRHSDETKRKLSVIRKKWIADNPDKIPYLRSHDSHGKSRLEILFEEAMLAENITGYTYNYRHHMYKYDFAFVDIKLDVEIDGALHKRPANQEHDRVRDRWSVSQGWRVLRFTNTDVERNLAHCISVLKDALKEPTDIFLGTFRTIKQCEDSLN